LEIRIGFESLIAGVIDDDDSGLIILICLGTSGTASPLFSKELISHSFLDTTVDDIGATNRIVGGDVGYC
jgi:hypothetical protein